MSLKVPLLFHFFLNCKINLSSLLICFILFFFYWSVLIPNAVPTSHEIVKCCWINGCNYLDASIWQSESSIFPNWGTGKNKTFSLFRWEQICWTETWEPTFPMAKLFLRFYWVERQKLNARIIQIINLSWKITFINMFP